MGIAKIIAHGEDVAVVIPKDVAQAAGLVVGADADLVPQHGRLEIASQASGEDEFAQQMAAARRIMDRHRDVLAKLAR